MVKSITFTIAEGFSELFYDPLVNVAAVCDTQKGCVYPFFLNLYKSRTFKGKTIQLDAESETKPDSEDTDQASQAQSSMAATRSMAGGVNPAASAAQPKASFMQRSFNYFRGGPQTF